MNEPKPVQSIKINTLLTERVQSHIRISNTYVHLQIYRIEINIDNMDIQHQCSLYSYIVKLALVCMLISNTHRHDHITHKYNIILHDIDV